MMQKFLITDWSVREGSGSTAARSDSGGTVFQSVSVTVSQSVDLQKSDGGSGEPPIPRGRLPGPHCRHDAVGAPALPVAVYVRMPAAMLGLRAYGMRLLKTAKLT